MEKPSITPTRQADSQSHLTLESGTTDSSADNEHLTPKETRQIVTPYAFFVADELLGTPLAGPFRRGFGMLIDLFFVILLTQVSSLVLAAIAAWTFFIAGNRLETQKRFNVVRIMLRLLVAWLLFVVAMGIVDEMTDNNPLNDKPTEASVNNVKGVDGIGLVALTAKYLLDTKALKQQIQQGECKPAFNCLQDLGENLIQDVIASGLDENAIEGVLDGYVEGVSESINDDEKQQLQKYLKQFAVTNKAVTPVNEFVPSEVEDIISEYSNDEDENKESKGLLARLENWAEELGLGFGWAAFYFSIFTAWWKGQTPGKSLLGMKVIKLDNQPLNLWESFGRYGGYAAGFATGLMGFLQVFWDPNRQAIQDKISETLVIDLRKPKVPFIKEMAE
ncbi:RDD family protein [Paraglaciecola arctica]|uniref:RDD domain-containing protein n=1 Tax=Paraglaciecola arctica BSs20135 TaxID=493475 RepID=K6YL97_9ALTE|nr:RDD family protein [Paraglaciecola arctica]GAC17383.1 hypothetical protein GARC_0401 [Paraglaciecola arctica BSs20135]